MSSIEDPDFAHVERLRGGDREALADLFDVCRVRLRRIAVFRIDSRLRGRFDADDVLQEAYLAAEARLSHFIETPTLSGFLWLRLVLGQTLIDLHRRHLGAHKRDARREVGLQGTPGSANTSLSIAAVLAADITSPSRVAMRAENLSRVQAALETMNPVDREVLALRHFEELSNKEVADVLEIQEKAASIRYVRALKRLKEILSEVSGTPPV